jgi:hypothetical protein
MKIGTTAIANSKIGNTQIQKIYIGNTLIWEYYCPELIAIIARATSSGFTMPSATVLTAMNTLILSLKAQGIWSVMDYIRLSAFNDIACQNFSRINWVNPTGTLATYVNTVPFTVSGFEGNGTSSYANSGINLSLATHYAQNDASRTHVIYKASTVGFGIDGTTTLTNRILNNNSNQQRINQSSNSLSANFSYAGTGMMSIIRTSSTNVNCINKATTAARTATSTAPENSIQFEQRTQGIFADGGTSFSMYGASITLIQAANFRTAFNTYLTAIGLTAFA